jgi:hypothetical protein
MITGLTVITAGCASTVRESAWRTKDITIDGNSTEWDTIASGNDQLRIGILNDEKYLYLCIISKDRDICRQALAFGCTVMVEPKSGHGNLLGIHYPIGISRNGMPLARPGRGEESKEPNEERILQSLSGMEIIGPQKDESRGLSKSAAESFGIHVCILSCPDSFVYELQLPLNTDSVCIFSIGAGNDSLVRVRLVTTKPPDPGLGPMQQGERHGPHPGTGGQGGGMPPQGGGPGGGGGQMRPPGEGMGPGGPPQAPESYKQDFTARLAKKPALP